MEFYKIIESIEQEQIRLTKKLGEPNELLQFLENFVANNYFSGIDKVIDIDFEELLIAYLCIDNPVLSYSEIRDKVQRNKVIAEGLDFESLNTLFVTSKIVKEMQDKTKIKLNGKLMLASGIFGNRDLKKLKLDLYSLAELLESNEDRMLRIISLIDVLSYLKQEYTQKISIVSQLIQEKELSLPFKKIKKKVENDIKESFNMKGIQNTLLEIQEYYKKVDADYKNQQKKIRKDIANYKEIKRILERGIKGEIIKVDKLVGLIANPTIRLQFLKAVYHHNITIYQTLAEEYRFLTGDIENLYCAVFNDYGIDFAKLTIEMKEKIKNIDLEVIKEMFSSIKNLQIEKDEALYILLNSNIEIVQSIVSLSTSGILPTSFILENREIFDERTNFDVNYWKFLKNISLLQSKTNIYNFSNDPSVFLTDSTLLDRNLKILEDYNLLPYFKTATQFTFLKSENLVYIIDSLLELGFEKNLEESLELLNCNEVGIKRLQILKSLNVPVATTEELLEVVTSQKFMIRDDELDDYIFNVVPYRRDTLLSLEDAETVKEEEECAFLKLEETTRTYWIENIVLSKNRIQRKQKEISSLPLSMNKKMMYSLVAGSVLSEEEYESIYRVVFQKEKEKRGTSF